MSLDSLRPLRFRELTRTGKLEDVLRTRVYLSNVADWETVSRVHGRYFGEIRPAATMIEAGLADPRMKIEIEVDAVVGSA